MRIWKVDCGHVWDNEDSCSTYSFGSYDGALMWILKNADELKWAAIEENHYLPCDRENPGGQLYIGCDTHQFFDKKDIQTMKYIHNNIHID
jgi:hypothetical protein